MCGERTALPTSCFAHSTRSTPASGTTSTRSVANWSSPPPSRRVPFPRRRRSLVPEMLELTAATEPGPFLLQTIQMGSYFRDTRERWAVGRNGRRALTIHCICGKSVRCALIPNFGRGYAQALVMFLAAQILEAGRTSFLHVKSENGAKVVYQKIGFRLRAAIFLTVISLR